MIDADEATSMNRSADEPMVRLRNLGPEALSEAELLGVILEHGRTHVASSRYAARVLDAYGGARALFRAGFGELAMDLGARRALRLMAAIELSRRALSAPLNATTALRSSRDVLKAYDLRLADLADEHVLVVLLDVKQRPVAERVIARGGPAGCAISVRDIFALAVREAAVALVLVHNHPSGDPTPSDEDRALTEALCAAGAAIGLPLVDHVIVARGRAFSFLDAGMLPEGRGAVR